MVILSYYYESKYRLREKKTSQMTKVLIQKEKFFKAELLQEGFFSLTHLFSRDVLVMKKLEIEKN